MSLSQRRFGVELEVILPFCPSKLPRGTTRFDKVATLLRQNGIPAMTEDEAKANPRSVGPDVWIVKDDETLGLPPGFKGGGSYYIWTQDERGLDHAWYFGLGHKENYFNLKDLADLEQGVKMVH